MHYRKVENDQDGVLFSAGAAGFSFIELLVVVGLLLAITVISIPYLFSYSRAFKTEDQALKVMDLMREANQLALTRRRTIRLEIDRNNIALPVARLIQEPDEVIKTIPLESLDQVRMDVAPDGIAAPNPPNYSAAVYTNNVWSIRFISSGAVVGDSGNPVSATLYSWRPITEVSSPFDINNLTPARPEEVRAVTIYGGSGAVRYWKYTGTKWVPSQ